MEEWMVVPEFVVTEMDGEETGEDNMDGREMSGIWRKLKLGNGNKRGGLLWDKRFVFGKTVEDLPVLSYNRKFPRFQGELSVAGTKTLKCQIPYVRRVFFILARIMNALFRGLKLTVDLKATCFLQHPHYS
jgi:hypothetical protein